MIHSDWHIHSEFSYDSKLPLQTIAEEGSALGMQFLGITDHVNYNDDFFLAALRDSAKAVKQMQEVCPTMVLGVELTPISKPQFDYIAQTGTREGFVAPTATHPFDIELAVSKEELQSLGVRYAIGAAHWRVDGMPTANADDLKESIDEWYRQQMWLACDERVTVLGHPWYHGKGLWYEDFTQIPHSMNVDIAHALKENGKYVECNLHFFNSAKTGERFRCQYAEFLRELFEMGISVTYGTDSHSRYANGIEAVEAYLARAGFRDGDIVGISEQDFW